MNNRPKIGLGVIILKNNGEPKILEPDRCEKWDWFEWNSLPKPLFLPIKSLIKEDFDPFEI